ncbi:hypothetical protein BJV74DRAFT_798804 [Russula compacta]|nr:hypothetical protein BJV74DRAFT_798804 [Russula compacta]
MVQFSILVVALSVAGSVTAAPTRFSKRIAQVIDASTTKWESACNAAGGADQCNSIAVNAFDTLLAGAGDCDQQNNADTMMDLSKKLNSQTMIQLTQIFAQQARNSPNSLSIPYCQNAPRNAELNGLFQCQFQGVDPNNFVGGLKPGDKGTIPFGQANVLNPPGSCPAHTSGPIAAGTQLVDQVSSPGVPSGTGGGQGNAQNPSPVSSASTTSATPAESSAAPSAASAAASTSPATSSGGAQGFAAQNGQDAQALNQKFQTLTPDSPCTDGENACVNGQFAQCSGGKFALTTCSAGETCTALPLVNSRGTSVTCDTQSDANTRIANALGSGGIESTDVLPYHIETACFVFIA